MEEEIGILQCDIEKECRKVQGERILFDEKGNYLCQDGKRFDFITGKGPWKYYINAAEQWLGGRILWKDG